jgi:hypothetical protein
MAHSVTLSWTAPAGSTVTSYNILRGTVKGGETALGTSPNTSYVDTASLVEGTLYYYVVEAVNASGISGPSNEVSVTIPFSIPGAPTNLVATAV